MKIKNGFTLIELLVVIAVLGVLAAGVFVAINPLKRISQANDARIKSDIGQLAQALQSYYTFHTGTYPSALAELETSGDIKKIPNPPVTGSYNYTLGGNEAVLYFPVQNTQSGTPSVWCWSSVTNTITQVNGVACDTTGGGITPTPTPTVTPTPDPLDIGLVGYWKMNVISGTNTPDASLNGYNGSLINSPTLTAGKFMNSLLFNGSSNYMQATPSKNGRTFVTLSGWVNFDNPDNINNVDKYHHLFGWNYEFKILFRTFPSQPHDGYFMQLNGTTATKDTNNISVLYSFPSKLSSWHHVAATYDGTQVKLYFDGNVVGTQNISDTGIRDTGRDFLVGGGPEVPYFDGHIDDVRIYNRALPPAEVTKLYNYTPSP